MFLADRVIDIPFFSCTDTCCGPWIRQACFIEFEHSPDDPTHLVESVVDLWKYIGLDVSSENEEELVNDRSEELITDEMKDLHLETQETVDKKVALEEEEETAGMYLLQQLRISSPCEIRYRGSKHNSRQGGVP